MCSPPRRLSDKFSQTSAAARSPSPDGSCALSAHSFPQLVCIYASDRVSTPAPGVRESAGRRIQSARPLRSAPPDLAHRRSRKTSLRFLDLSMHASSRDDVHRRGRCRCAVRGCRAGDQAGPREGNTSNVLILQPFRESAEREWATENSNKSQDKLVRNLRKLNDGLAGEGFRVERVL